MAATSAATWGPSRGVPACTWLKRYTERPRERRDSYNGAMLLNCPYSVAVAVAEQHSARQSSRSLASEPTRYLVVLRTHEIPVVR